MTALRSSVPTYIASLSLLSSDGEIESVIEMIRRYHVGDATVVAQMAIVLAKSGKLLSPDGSIVADVASTGGPSSLSTLLTPLFISLTGALVPKLGVPGRPAGGIDCLAQIPGFRTEMTMGEARRILEQVGYVHFIAKGEAAPLDRRLFAIRQKVGAQAIPELVVASILAKKLATGVNYAGLEIRVASHGNFGKDWSTAIRNAELYKRTADLLEMKAKPILTDGRYPYQPFLGRKESLMALYDIFEGREGEWLQEHCGMCRLLAAACVPPRLRGKITKIGISDLQEQFSRNLIAQGATYADFERVVAITRNEHTISIAASRDGFCFYPLEEIRDIIVECQEADSDRKGGRFPDPVGVVLKRRAGEWVRKGTLLATLRPSGKKFRAVCERLAWCIASMSSLSCSSGFQMIYG